MGQVAELGLAGPAVTLRESEGSSSAAGGGTGRARRRLPARKITAQMFPFPRVMASTYRGKGCFPPPAFVPSAARGGGVGGRAGGVAIGWRGAVGGAGGRGARRGPGRGRARSWRRRRGERGAAGAQVGPAAPRHPPGAGEPLTNAHCALGDSTVRVTAANLLLGHRCAAASPCFASTDPRLDAMTPATTPRHPEIALRLGLCCLMTNPWRCHWQKQLRRSPGKTCPSYHEQHCGVNASDFLLPTEPSCSAPVSKGKGLK
ncbi:uncharacterized protein LOC134514227 [Chroicocephalus ridibundus]|uniref:uncharacterized protein LOC134514227 n=1 Tax=Chroicocephalus ridibundus TaxID=1192867 RepID=UPI002FDC865C